MTSALSTAIIRDAGEFVALEPEWWKLWRRTPSATPFQSSAWLLPWWDAFAPGALHVVTVRRGSELVGLAPFYLDRQSSGSRILPIGISVSDYLDVLLAPECAALTAAALSSAMIASATWRSWEMPELATEAQARALPCHASCEERRECGPTCPFLRLPSGVEELRGRFPPRKRRSIALNRNRAERRGEVTVRSLRDTAANELFAELLRLHGLCWKIRGRPGVLADENVRNFHRKAIPRLAETGLLRLYALDIGGEVAAAYYGFLHGVHAYGYLTGFDPAFGHESPGTLLMVHVMEEAIREGAREFHFLRGNEPYKYGWGAVDRWNQRRVFLRRASHAG